MRKMVVRDANGWCALRLMLKRVAAISLMPSGLNAPALSKVGSRPRNLLGEEETCQLVRSAACGILK